MHNQIFNQSQKIMNNAQAQLQQLTGLHLKTSSTGSHLPGAPKLSAQPAGQVPPVVNSPLINPLVQLFNNRKHLAEVASSPIPAVIAAMLAQPVAYFMENPSDADEGQAPLTHVAFVLDDSGSMAYGKEATVEGFNSQVLVVKEGAKLAGETTFTDVRFNSVVALRTVAGNIANIQELTSSTYSPSGGTALYDALGETIAALLGTKGINSPKTAILVTAFTDGDENASRVYSVAMVKALIERLEATGRWTFALVGPAQSVTGLAGQLAVNLDNIAGYDVTSIAGKQEAFGKAAGASASYMSMRSMGITSSASLYSMPGSQ